MNLTQLKAEAEKAKTSDIELGFWREDISPDDVLRLVEVARAARVVLAWPMHKDLNQLAVVLKGIEP